MKFKIDENLPSEIAELLRSSGHDAMTVLEQHLKGRNDSHIAEDCRQEGRTLVTADLDFADVKTYPPEHSAGMIVLRLARQDKPHVISIFQKVMTLFAAETIPGKLWIVEETRVRIRGEQ